MTAIIMNKNKDEISYQLNPIWLLILSVFFNLMIVGITFLFLNVAIQEKSTGFLSAEVHEKLVKNYTNNEITELREKFSELDAVVTEFRKNLTEQIRKLAINASVEIAIGDLVVMSELEEFKNVSQSQFKSLEKRTFFLENRQRDNSNMEELVKNLNESRTATNATITDLKQITSSQIDMLYVLINELVAKCNWLQEKIGY